MARIKKEQPVWVAPFKIAEVAAAYSPGRDTSTIGSAGLNGSVRNGKRCSPAHCHQPISVLELR